MYAENGITIIQPQTVNIAVFQKAEIYIARQELQRLLDVLARTQNPVLGARFSSNWQRRSNWSGRSMHRRGMASWSDRSGKPNTNSMAEKDELIRYRESDSRYLHHVTPAKTPAWILPAMVGLLVMIRRSFAAVSTSCQDGLSGGPRSGRVDQ